MTNVEEIEEKIKSLSSDELRLFRAWYGEYDAELWDSQIERDARSGRLKSMAQDALTRHERGESKPL